MPIFFNSFWPIADTDIFHFVWKQQQIYPSLFSVLYMYGLLGLFPTSGENLKSSALLEIYLRVQYLF